tara:strand:+ start:176 stop:1363 length:1188 start_codon:yes stop_codon:yes gene_type:complete
MYLTLNKWLGFFACKKLSLPQFINKGKVRKSNGDLVSLKEIIEEKDIPDSIVTIFYELFVKQKEKYLTNFYNRSLRISQKKLTQLCINNDKYKEHKNVVRNLYFKEILLETGTIQPNLRNFLDVIIDLFKHQIIDYKLVTPSSIKLISKRKLSNILSGLYFRSSIMNPLIPYTLSSHLDYKFKVLTPTLGWSSYLLGMIENKNLEEYVGIDVINKVCKNTAKLSNKNNIKNDIYCVPSEDLYKDTRFMSKYTSYFDFIFFSPPYFQLELYKGNRQSTERYRTYEEWLDGYWKNTIKLCYSCLKKHRLMIYIVSGYTSKNKYINLEKDMNTITKSEGFNFIKKLHMVGNNVGFTKHRQSKETIFVFSKGKINNNQSRKLTKYFKQINKCNKKTKRK